MVNAGLVDCRLKYMVNDFCKLNEPESSKVDNSQLLILLALANTNKSFNQQPLPKKASPNEVLANCFNCYRRIFNGQRSVVIHAG